MLPVEVLLSHLGPPILLLLQLLLSPTSAFFPNIWSLLAAPGSLTHQDLTEEAALNVTLQLFLEHPPPGRPRLRLEDYKVSIPGSSQILPFPWFLRALVVRVGSPTFHLLTFHSPYATPESSSLGKVYLAGCGAHACDPSS